MAVIRLRLMNKRFTASLIGLISGFSMLFLIVSEKVVPPWDPTSMMLLGQSLVQRQSLQYFDAHNSEIAPYFNPHGFNIRVPSDAQPYSTFPPGFSLVLAVVYTFTGSLDWMYFIPPTLTVVGLAASAYLGYILSGSWGSLFAVLLLGCSHVVAAFATSLWSDGPSLDLLLVGMALSIWAVRSNRKSAALGAGLCWGLFILFKFVNMMFVILIVVGIVIFWKDGMRRVIWWLLPGLVGGVAGMLLYQAIAYGGPLANAYQPWGRSLYDFPLFSPTYLFFKSPYPWNDLSNNAILSGISTDMQLWAGVFVIALVIDRRNPLRLLLALIVMANVTLYAVSVFSPRQFINMRYLLPALAAAYILVADVLARTMKRLSVPIVRLGLIGLVSAICLRNLLVTVLPDLTNRNAGTSHTIQMVKETSRSLPPNTVVLAYSLADSFILYGNLSTLNYRRVSAPDINTRNALVMHAIDKMICQGQPVYLVKDDESLFNSIYPDLAHSYVLRTQSTPIITYEIQLKDSDQRCAASATGAAAGSRKLNPAFEMRELPLGSPS